MKVKRIALIPDDGIGQEPAPERLRMLRAVARQRHGC